MQSLRDSFNKDRLRLNFLLDLCFLGLDLDWNKTCVAFVLASSKPSYTYIHILSLFNDDNQLKSFTEKIFLLRDDHSPLILHSLLSIKYFQKGLQKKIYTLYLTWFSPPLTTSKIRKHRNRNNHSQRNQPSAKHTK